MEIKQCEYCMNLAIDEETDEEYCSMNMDQDEIEKLRYNPRSSCTGFRMGDDYTIVKKQGF
jgi:pyruvate-formate lyase-activating enzyme